MQKGPPPTHAPMLRADMQFKLGTNRLVQKIKRFLKQIGSDMKNATVDWVVEPKRREEKKKRNIFRPERDRKEYLQWLVDRLGLEITV